LPFNETKSLPAAAFAFASASAYFLACANNSLVGLASTALSKVAAYILRIEFSTGVVASPLFIFSISLFISYPFANWLSASLSHCSKLSFSTTLSFIPIASLLCLLASKVIPCSSSLPASTLPSSPTGGFFPPPPSPVVCVVSRTG